MSFHLTSQNLRLEFRDDRTYLLAETRREDGSENNTSICLDDCLGNDNGRFQWDGVNFTETAADITFSIEGGGAVPVLRASLKNSEDILQPADVNLSERIKNRNGDLVFE